MPLLLIGQAPGDPHSRRRRGRSAERLSRLLGIEPAALSQYVTWRNLLQDFPGKAGAGDAFPLARARQQAAACPLAPVTLLLGQQVAHAFGLSLPYFQWHTLRGCQLVVIPHPSGVNHWYNDPANRARAQGFLRRLCSVQP